MLWAVVLGAGAVGGPVGLAIVMTPVVAVAATSGARLTEVRRGTRGLLAVVAVLVPLTAIAGPTAWAGGSLVAVVAGWGILAASGHRASSRVLALACVPAIAAGSVVAASREDSAVAAMLIAVVCLFDAGNFVVGTGETGGVAGALAGSALVAVAMVILASLVDANLRGRPIAVLAAVAVVAFPLGVALGRRLTGPRPLPAFRRLDSLLFAGPAWLAAMAVVLPH